METRTGVERPTGTGQAPKAVPVSEENRPSDTDKHLTVVIAALRRPSLAVEANWWRRLGRGD